MKRLLFSAVALCVVCSSAGTRQVHAQDLTPVARPPVNGPLYPCPKPDVPAEVGWTMITNPAFSPHEMTYAHSYRAIYPPYYYKNTCGLACLPFFPKPHLIGTEVRVKYCSHYPFGAGLPYLPYKHHYHNNQAFTWYANPGWSHR